MSRKNKPNIMFIIPHDLGDHLGCYGHEDVKSPNLDRMASEGVKFTNCFSAAPECTASRGGMMTGLYAHQNGLVGLCGAFGWELNPDVPHLAERMKDNGYSTHLFGFQHETCGDVLSLGYDKAHSPGKYKAAQVCESVANFLRDDASGTEQPWFAYVGFFDVHRQWPETSSFDPAKIRVPDYLPDTPEIRMDFSHFYQNIADMDQSIGTIFDALKTHGLDENTVVIFTTDHGAPFPRAKSTFFDPGIKTPLIVRSPGCIKGGRVCDSLVSNLDIAPTVLETTGAQVPDNMEGRSLAPLLFETPGYDERDAVYGAMYYDVSYDPMHYVRTRDWKYIRSFAVDADAVESVDPEVLARHRLGEWIRMDDFDVTDSFAWKSIYRGTELPPSAEELYDLKADPLEKRNLAEYPAHAQQLENMRALMRKMMDRTCSPLLTRHVCPTEGQKKMSPHYLSIINASELEPPTRQRTAEHMKMYEAIQRRMKRQ